MCIIIQRPANHGLTIETLQSCSKKNSDGWGIMWAEFGRVRVDRGMDWDSFIPAYRRLPLETPCVIHFRIKTHGQINLDNTHPFIVLDLDRDGTDLWVMHNGVISTLRTDETMSDTWHWVRDVARPILLESPRLLQHPAFVSMMQKDAGHSRLIFLDGDGVMTKLNKKSWHDHQGCWFSNTTALPPITKPAPAPYQGTGASYYGGGSNQAQSYYPNVQRAPADPQIAARLQSEHQAAWKRAVSPTTWDSRAEAEFAEEWERHQRHHDIVQAFLEEPEEKVLEIFQSEAAEETGKSPFVGGTAASAAVEKAPTPTRGAEPFSIFGHYRALAKTFLGG